MTRQQTSQLYDKHSAIVFYEDRYAHGYMDEWPAEKKQRVFEIVRGLGLPETGSALDFGCGNGVFTDVLRQALPGGWTVSGTDISAIAVENARARFSACRFFVAGAAWPGAGPFDFLFTHHVLEHVYDLPQILDEIDRFLAPDAAVLHILPCGNEGSLEHSICLLRKNGIDPSLENRFFFEDEGHVRRLTTEQLSGRYAVRGFSLEQEYYSYHHHATIDWVSQYGPPVLNDLTDPSAAVDNRARHTLTRLRRTLLLWWALRHPAAMVEEKLRKRGRSPRDWALLAAGLLLYPVSKPIDTHLRRRTLAEWRARKTDRRGSEMYLLFRRRARS